MAQPNQLPPLVEPPPIVVVEVEQAHSTNHSIETLVVVLAVITILGVIAGIIARLCNGRQFGGSGEHDVEGWVERRCRSCIDGGIATEVPPPPPATKEEPAKPAAGEEAKK
ncbi:hypothetical protein CASFOL_025457 [Castilleja foliolosa]|uniref:Transmembrane protein n=1 Tax=Castilleja foliolosa TaxID=1961234 RepID=A0ABD3CR62_9LAMI